MTSATAPWRTWPTSTSSRQLQQYIDGILAYNDGMDISDGAIWPDQIKRQRPDTAPLHFIGPFRSPVQQRQTYILPDARDSP